MFLLFLFFQPQAVFAKTIQKKCGENIFLVHISYGANDSLRKIGFYVKAKSGQKKLLYTTKKGSYFFVTCIKSSKNQDFILFQEIKGLNASPEDIYGIFEPNTLAMIINPSDWPNGNQRQVKKLVGYQPPFVNGYDGGFFVVLIGIIN